MVGKQKEKGTRSEMQRCENLLLDKYFNTKQIDEALPNQAKL